MEKEPEDIHTRAAITRLQKDLKEIRDNPSNTVYAEPLPQNIWEWHVNLIGPNGRDYEGICIHLSFSFPKNYPQTPPKVELLTPVTRSHVYGRWICLDMLESWSGFSQKNTVVGVQLILLNPYFYNYSHGYLSQVIWLIQLHYTVIA